MPHAAEIPARRHKIAAALEAAREAARADVDPQFHPTTDTIIRLAVEAVAHGGQVHGAIFAVYTALLPLLSHDGSNEVQYHLSAALDTEVAA